MSIYQPSTYSEQLEKKDFILFGIQGSGKGTQGESLAQEFGMQQVISGDLLRKASEMDSDLAREITQYVKSGQLVPAELFTKLIEETVHSADVHAPMLFDGLPRSEAQKPFVDGLIHERGRTATAIHLVIPDALARERIETRAKQSKNPRKDDLDPVAIENRIKAFHKTTGRAIHAYKEEGNLIEIDATAPIGKVYRTIVKELGLVRGAVKGTLMAHVAPEK